MKSYSILSLFSFCAFLLALPAFADDDSKAARWLTENQEQALSDTVPPPPPIDSAEDKADYAQILAAQNSRTPEVIAESKKYQSFGYKPFFEDICGADLTEDKAPKFHKLIKEVLKITGVVNEAAKNKYRRLRPYQEHPDTVHSLFAVGGYSYPSGHSMGSFTLATVLGAIFPDKQQALLDRAAQIAQSRVNAGVHNPSDIKEGEVLGKATGAAILASPAFQQDLAAVKQEFGK
jgi:acid phosphatase (class A)